MRAWALITKHRLAENLRALPAFEDIDVETVAPPTYYVKVRCRSQECVEWLCRAMGLEPWRLVGVGSRVPILEFPARAAHSRIF